MPHNPPFPHPEYLKIVLPDVASLPHDSPLQEFTVCRQQEALTAHANPPSAAWWLESARFALNYGRFTEAEEAASRAVRIALPAGQVEAVAEAWSLQIWQMLYQGKFGIARRLLDQIAIFAGSGAGTRLEALYLETEGQFLLQSGNIPTGEYAEAEPLFRRAVELYRACGDAAGEIRTFEGWARSHAALGRYPHAVEIVDTGLARCQATGEWRYCGALLACAASALSDYGYREGVARLFDLALEWSDFVGNRVSRLMGLYGKGRLYSYEMEAGAAPEAVWRAAPLRHALEEAETLQILPIAVYCHHALAVIYQKAGDLTTQDYHRQLADRMSGMAGADAMTPRYAAHEIESYIVQLGRVNKSAAQLLAGIESSPDPFLIFVPVYRPDGALIDLDLGLRNTASGTLLGRRASCRMFSELAELPHFDDLKTPLYAAIERGEPYQDEICVCSAAGESVWWMRRISPSENGAVIIFRDVSESHHLRQLTRELAHSALHDGLTGLPNRVAFLQRLEAVCDPEGEKRQHTLCFMDLDGFKAVNDGAGHAAGDALLCEVAHQIRQHLRPDDFAARLGGDEFALLLSDCSPAEAEGRAARLVVAIRHLSFLWHNIPYSIGASIGLTPLHAVSASPDAILNRADLACYAAKASGKNRVVISGSESVDSPIYQPKTPTQSF